MEEVKKLEALKTRIADVKKRVEEARANREAKKKMEASGKGQVGAIQEEQRVGGTATAEQMPNYFKEIVTASDRFKSMGLLSG